MNLFNSQKKKRALGERKLLEDKITEALNFVPTEYPHTEKFIADGKNPIDAAEELIKKAPASDYLCSNMLDKYIDEETTREKEYGNKHFVTDMQTINQLMDSAETFSKKAEAELVLLNEDRERILRERARLIDLYNRLSISEEETK